MSENRNTRVQLYWNTLLRIPSQLISFIISLLIARLLEPRDFGIMGIAMMLIGYANIFTNFGFSEAIIQKGISDKKILNSIFTFNFAVSTMLAGGFFLFSGFIADFFNTPECRTVIRVQSLVFIITAFPVIPTAILRKNMDFRTISVVDIIHSILMSVITLGMAWKGFGYWALVYGQIIPLILVSIILCLRMRFVPVLGYSHALMKNIYHFGGWNFLRVQLMFISQHVDRFVIGKWLGPVQLGFYDKALTLGTTPYNTFIMNINSVMFSSFSIDKEEIDQLQESSRKIIGLLAFINFPIYFGLIAIAPHFVYCLLGEKWMPMIVPFQIILAALIFRSFTGILTSLNVGVGRYKEHTVRSLIALLVFTSLCITFRNQGIKVISICFMVYCILEIALLTDLSRQVINVGLLEILQPIFPGLLSSLIMFFITVVASNLLFKAYSIFNMLMTMFLGVAVYILCIAMSPSTLTREFRLNLIHDFRRILLRK